MTTVSVLLTEAKKQKDFDTQIKLKVRYVSQFFSLLQKHSSTRLTLQPLRS